MTTDLTDKVIVLTGVTGGIGRVAARTYLEHGAVVIGSDIDDEAGEKLAAELSGDGYDFTFVAGDVTQAATAQALADLVRERHGRLDVLHNNAGVLVAKGVQDTTEEEWDLVMNVSVRGTFLMIRALSPLMGEGGSIINMGSSLGLVGGANEAAYCAAKGAIVNFTKAVACDLAPEIRVNAICPGGIDTPMPRNVVGALPPEDRDAVWKGLEAEHLLGRLGQPEEVATLALFLAGDDSTFVNGTAIAVDGGWTAR
ncbi:SDR family NAD(P)-dependent oxidoreductase [Nocardioides sp.]|uniref:SDR family NAD(P)-dependent oxidoreductase n=1 Tax=Nocardioides sp. TaxID=35761 RepID=UPI0039E61713